MYNGWTPTIPQEIKQSNELQAITAILAEQPDNAYWLAHYASLTADLTAPAIPAGAIFMPAPITAEAETC